MHDTLMCDTVCDTSCALDRYHQCVIFFYHDVDVVTYTCARVGGHAHLSTAMGSIRSAVCTAAPRSAHIDGNVDSRRV